MHEDRRATEAGIDRRAALGAIGGLAAMGAVAAAAGNAGRRGTAVVTQEQLGWNESRGEYVLPDLPYAYTALEPHIDTQTMQIHHDKHHQGYVNGTNRALQALEDIRMGRGDPGLIKHWSRELSFNGSGHVNHTMFWFGMAPEEDGGGGQPEDDALAERLEQDFGSFNQFAAHFKLAAGAVEGSGWGWLVHDPVSGKLRIIQGEKQQDLMMTGVVPLLGVDVWEHAYYLRYQNRRGDYLDAFMNVINWSEIARRYRAATT